MGQVFSGGAIPEEENWFGDEFGSIRDRPELGAHSSYTSS